MKNVALLIISLAMTNNLVAQLDKTKEVKRIRINEISFQTGLIADRAANIKIDDFQKLAPQSVLLKNDFTGYSDNSSYGIYGGLNMFSALVGIQFLDKQKTGYKSNPQLRLGLNYVSSTSVAGGAFKEDRKAFDTLTSNQTNDIYLVDSVTTRYYGLEYSSQQLRLDGSLIFRTNTERIVTLFTGFGFMAGMSLNSKTNIRQQENKSIDVQNPTDDGTVNSNYNYNTSKNVSEVFYNISSFGLSTYIPMGVDFRMGNKKEFWKNLHLFYELRPALNFTKIQNIQTIVNTSFQHGIGLKVTW